MFYINSNNLLNLTVHSLHHQGQDQRDTDVNCGKLTHSFRRPSVEPVRIFVGERQSCENCSLLHYCPMGSGNLLPNIGTDRLYLNVGKKLPLLAA